MTTAKGALELVGQLPYESRDYAPLCVGCGKVVRYPEIRCLSDFDSVTGMPLTARCVDCDRKYWRDVWAERHGVTA